MSARRRGSPSNSSLGHAKARRPATHGERAQSQEMPADTPTRPTDVEVVADTLARRLRPHVRRLSLASVRNTHDAENATQLALLDIVRGTAGFRGECTLETWADRITIRAATRVARQRRVGATRHEAVDPDELPPALPNDIGSDLPRSIASYLDELPTSRRTLLVLRHVLGLSVQGIAAATAVSVNTVKDRSALDARRCGDWHAATPSGRPSAEARRYQGL